MFCLGVTRGYIHNVHKRGAAEDDAGRKNTASGKVSSLRKKGSGREGGGMSLVNSQIKNNTLIVLLSGLVVTYWPLVRKCGVPALH